MWAHQAVGHDMLRAESSGFDGSIEENNPIQIIIQGALNNYWELNPDSDVFTCGGVNMPHPEYYSEEPDLKKFETFVVGII